MEYPKRKRVRLKEFDYSQDGAYFITICTRFRQPILWDARAACSRPRFSQIGIISNNEINRISDIYENVTIDNHVIMPNHIHMIIVLQGDRHTKAPAISRIIQQFKGKITKQTGHPIWQKSFYEHIIRNEEDYLEICNYIDNNPIKWELDCYYDIDDNKKA